MGTECPVCRQPIHWFRLFRTTAWGSWRCDGCGSLLGVRVWRRLLPTLIWVILYLGPTRLVRVPFQWDFAVAMSLLLVVLVPYFMFFERAKVLERCGFRCRQCGYDLRGQVKPRCPECGKQFDDAEIAQMQQADPAAATEPVARPSSRRGWIVIILLLALVLAQGAYVFVRSYRRQRQGTPPVPRQKTSAPAAT